MGSPHYGEAATQSGGAGWARRVAHVHEPAAHAEDETPVLSLSTHAGAGASVQLTQVPPQPSSAPASVPSPSQVQRGSASPRLKSWFIMVRPDVVKAKPQCAVV